MSDPTRIQDVLRWDQGKPTIPITDSENRVVGYGEINAVEGSMSITITDDNIKAENEARHWMSLACLRFCWR